MNQDVINTADLTYFVSPSVFRLDHELDDVLEIVREFSARSIHRDFYKEDKPEPVIEVKKEEPTSVEVVEISEEEPVIETIPEPQKVEDTPKEEPTKVEEPKVEEKAE